MRLVFFGVVAAAASMATIGFNSNEIDPATAEAILAWAKLPTG